MDPIMTRLALDMARQRESIARQWHAAEVRIITMSGEDIGWLQTKTSDSTPWPHQAASRNNLHAGADKPPHNRAALSKAFKGFRNIF